MSALAARGDHTERAVRRYPSLGRPKGEYRTGTIKTFIKAVEYWVPGNDRLHLEYGGGLYGQATRFAVLSRKLCFGRGEGLPGKAWEQGHPLLLKQFEGSYFQRTAAAHAEGLTGALACRSSPANT